MKNAVIAAFALVAASASAGAGESLEGLCVISAEGTTITIKCGNADIAAYLEAKRKEMDGEGE